MNSIQWTEIHDALQLVMQRELETIRRLLENLHLEEQMILQNQKKHWGAMIKERESLFTQLQELVQEKDGITKKLESQASLVNALLEELLPPQHGATHELLSLRDQMITLRDRMSLQTSRNEMLKRLAGTRAPSKNKIRVATAVKEEYKSGDA